MGTLNELLYVLGQFLPMILTVTGYLGGYAAAYIVKRALCPLNNHNGCAHTPFALFWPVSVPGWFAYHALRIVFMSPHWLMESLETGKQRKMLEAKKRREDIEYALSLSDKNFGLRTRQLELDNGMEPSYDEEGRPIGHDEEEAEDEPEEVEQPPESVNDLIESLDISGDTVTLTEKQVNYLQQQFLLNSSLPAIVMGDPPTISPYGRGSEPYVDGHVNLTGITWLTHTQVMWSKRRLEAFVTAAGFNNARCTRLFWEQIGTNHVATAEVSVRSANMAQFHICLDNLRQNQARMDTYGAARMEEFGLGPKPVKKSKGKKKGKKK